VPSVPHTLPALQETALQTHAPLMQTGVVPVQTLVAQGSVTCAQRFVALHTQVAGQEPCVPAVPAHLQSPSAASQASPTLQVTPWHLFVPPTHLPVQSQVKPVMQVPQGRPQSSEPHTRVPQPQVKHAPFAHFWSLPQQSEPQRRVTSEQPPHWPEDPQYWPLGQPPQEPAQPSAPHCLPAQDGTQVPVSPG
jgi:hypothetical protein